MADRKRFGDEQSGNMGQGRWAGDYMEAAETVKQRIIKTNQHKECLEKIDTFMADSCTPSTECVPFELKS